MNAEKRLEGQLFFDFTPQRCCFIFGGKAGGRDRPGNAQFWIIPADASRIVRMIEIRYLIVEMGDIAGNNKTVCQSWWNP